MSGFYSEPDKGVTGNGPAQSLLPRVEKRTKPQFQAKCSRHVYEWNQDAGEWLPRLSKLRFDPGQAGVTITNGRVDISDARRAALDKGRELLANPEPRLAAVLPEGRYATRTRAIGGWAYHYVWETPIEVMPGVVEWEVDHDQHIAVLREIKAQVLGGEPPLNWKRLQLRKQQKLVQQIEDKLSSTPQFAQNITGRLERSRAILEGMQADYDAQVKAEAPAKTAPKKAPAKKASTKVAANG